MSTLETNAWQDNVFGLWEDLLPERQMFNHNYLSYVQYRDSDKTGLYTRILTQLISGFLQKCNEQGMTLDDKLLDADGLRKELMTLKQNERDDLFKQIAALMSGVFVDQSAWRKQVDELFQHPLFHTTTASVASQNIRRSDEMKATIDSFSAPFIGNNLERLWEHITLPRDEQFKLHENTCAIVQSSGMGKSRTIAELGKKCILISICIRGENQNHVDVGYPPSDEDLRDFLMFDTKNPNVARGRCFALLIGLYKHTLSVLKGADLHSEEKMGQWIFEKMSWSFGDTKAYRQKFFQEVIKIAKKSQRTSETGHSVSEELYNSISEFMKFLRGLEQRKKAPRGPKIVIAFDEAHSLTSVGGVIEGTRERTWNMHTSLKDAFRACRTFPVWGLFLSTMEKPLQPDPPSVVDPSSRVVRMTLFPVSPFTTFEYDTFAPKLGWDDGRKMMLLKQETEGETGEPAQKKTRIEAEQVELTLNEITHIAFLVKFGRPMFAMRYKLGGRETRQNILHFAVQQLICNDPSIVLARKEQIELSVPVAIACLSQRLCLEFDMNSYNAEEEKQISGHMRLCIKIGPDNKYIISSPGSEPLLAEAAALIMMHKTFLPAHNLKKVFGGFGLSPGLRGETVAMLAVTIARDAIVRENIVKWCEDNGVELPDVFAGRLDEDSLRGKIGFRVVQVIPFLERLIGDDGGDSTDREKDRGGNGEAGGEKSEIYGDKGKGKEKEGTKDTLPNKDGWLDGARLYFNHFIEPIDQSTFILKCFMGYMTRGAALLCAKYMSAVDFALPILFGETLLLSAMSFILVQVRNDRSITQVSRSYLFGAMDIPVHSLFEEVENPKPVIRIIFSLRSKGEVHCEWKEIKVNQRTYRSLDIWIPGLNFHRKGETRESWSGLLTTRSDIEEGLESLLPGVGGSEEHWQWFHGIPGIDMPEAVGPKD